MMYTSMNQAISSTIRRGTTQNQPQYEDDRIDQAISNSDSRSTGRSDIASLLSNQGFEFPEGMDSQEYVSRALISIAKQFGATAEDIEKILKTRIESTAEDGSGPDSLGFIFTDVAEEIKDLTDKIEKYLNLGKFKDRTDDVLKENSEEERRKRREQEDRNRPPVQPPETSVDRALKFIAETFREITPGAEDRYKKEQQDPKTQRRPMDELLKSFSDFMGAPEINEESRGADLQDAINDLTGAVKDNTNAQKGEKAERSKGQEFIRKALIWTAKTAKPLGNLAQKIVPQAWQNTINRFTANTAARVAARSGISPALAARAAIAAGPIGWVVAAATVIADFLGGLKNVVGTLRQMAAQAMKTVDSIAQYNSALIAAKTELSVGRLKRDIEMAQYVAQSGAENLNLQNQVESEWVFWERIKNDIGLWFNSWQSWTSIKTAEMLKFAMEWRKEFTMVIAPIMQGLHEIESIRKMYERWLADDKKEDNVLKNTDLMKFHGRFFNGDPRLANPGIRQAPQLPAGGANARQQMIGGGK